MLSEAISMAQKPTEQRQLVTLAAEAQKLLQEFIRLPLTEPGYATDLLMEFDRKVAEFKRLQAKIESGPKKARVLRLADAPAPRQCPICRQRVVLRKRNYVETKTAIYHRACYSAAIDRQSKRSSR
jgi:hypothetical protein